MSVENLCRLDGFNMPIYHYTMIETNIRNISINSSSSKERKRELRGHGPYFIRFRVRPQSVGDTIWPPRSWATAETSSTSSTPVDSPPSPTGSSSNLVVRLTEWSEALVVDTPPAAETPPPYSRLMPPLSKPVSWSWVKKADVPIEVVWSTRW